MTRKVRELILIQALLKEQKNRKVIKSEKSKAKLQCMGTIGKQLEFVINAATRK